MKVNWKVRLSNPTFWRGLISAVGMAVVSVLGIVGVDAADTVEQWQVALGTVVTAVFSVLTLLGVVADPTTEGLCDSARAMGYEAPAKSLSTTAEEALDE